MVSNPVVRTVQPKIICKQCQDEGHTKRSCSIAKAQNQPENISEDDKMFWFYVVEQECPSTLVNMSADSDSSEGDGDYSSDEDEIMDWDWSFCDC